MLPVRSAKGVLEIIRTAMQTQVDVKKQRPCMSNGCMQSEHKSQSKIFTAQEVAQHSSREDCWIILDNQVSFRVKLSRHFTPTDYSLEI